jgi:hypothetical protein
MTFEQNPVGAPIIDSTAPNGTLFTGAGTGNSTWEASGNPKTSTTDQNVFAGTRAGVIHVVKSTELQLDPTKYSADMGVNYSVKKFNLVKGSEYWERFNLYLPPSFDAYTGVTLKFFMNGKRDGDGTVRGAMFVNMGGGNVHQGGYQVTSEWQQFHGGVTHVLALNDLPAGTGWKAGEWQSFELYVYVSDVPGDAIVRFWRNNVLAFELHDVLPIVSADGWVDHLKIFPYWNGANTSATIPNFAGDILIDNFIVTDGDAPPPNLDADGNRFIGGGF